MDQSVVDALGHLGDLTDDELSSLQDQILSAFTDAQGGEITAESVNTLTQLADAMDAVRAESTRRTEESASLEQQAADAASRIKAGAPDAEDQGEAPETGAPDAEDQGEAPEAVAAAAADAEAPVVEAVAEAPAAEVELPVAAETATPEVASTEVVEPAEAAAEVIETEAAPVVSEDSEQSQEDSVTAAGTPEVQEPTIEVPEANRPSVTVVEAPVAITAGADIPGVTAGAPLADMDAVADAFVHRLHAMGRVSGGDGEQHTVASLTASYPADRVLSPTNSAEANWAQIQEVVSPRAITAAGGLCAPVNTRYELYGLGVMDRPVKDSLAGFNADRGGINFVTPPVLADLSGSASLWTVQDDIDAATAGAPDPTKPCIRVACGSPATVNLDAIPLCLTFGNIVSRTYPEMVKRNNELGLINHARYAETRLLTRIQTLSTAVTAAASCSTATDFFTQVDKGAAGYRNRYRLPETYPLRVILPTWFHTMLRADIANRAAGSSLDQNLGVADAAIASFFANRHINVTWTLDGVSGQILGTQAAGALNSFPSTLVWNLFSEGTFLFLDGGTLDLGLVRDSTLNGVNDYKMFLETFEGVAKVGIEALVVTSNIGVLGKTSGVC